MKGGEKRLGTSGCKNKKHYSIVTTVEPVSCGNTGSTANRREGNGHVGQRSHSNSQVERAVDHPETSIQYSLRPQTEVRPTIQEQLAHLCL